VTNPGDHLQVLQQRRASHAWDAACRVEKMKKKEAQDYCGEARKLPMRVLAAGLGPALAFIVAKAKDKKPGLDNLHNDLSNWVLKGRPIPSEEQNFLLQAVIKGDTAFLRLATDEALAYLQWLNRFLEAKGLGKKDEE